jgi:carbon monoxide dehydrogenase subunit G
MKFSSKEDIEAPLDQVFAVLSDFEIFERAAIRRGAEVHRRDDMTAPGAGMRWEASFMMRGKQRDAVIELVTYDRPNEMVFESHAGGVEGFLDIDLVALAPRRTRLSVNFEVKPKTLPARLLIQSMKLAKSNLTKRFKLRVAGYARDIEERCARTA